LLLTATATALGAKAFDLTRATRVKRNTVGFFHPVANDGGGGERVLWCAMRAVMAARPKASVVLYTDLPAVAQDREVLSDGSEEFSVEGEEEEEEETFWSRYMRERAREKFGVILPSRLEVVELKTTSLLNPSMYPRLTLLLQSLTSTLVGGEALYKLTPQVYIDTCGVPFVLPLARLFGCRTACYVHYPVISTNMLQRVKQRKRMYNNASTGTASSYAKMVYYKLFALIYGCVGSFAQVCMTNSSWTRGHVQDIFWWKYWWQRRAAYIRPLRVFPPCNTESLTKIPLKSPKRNTKSPVILSIGQFRPEKDHRMQLEAYALALKRAEGSSKNLKVILQSKLVLVGGCRSDADRQRVEDLKARAKELGLGDDRVEFLLNVPYSTIRDLLSQAVVGIHTMVDEHFGIGIVEYMASGVIAVANNSGGPAADIITPLRDEKKGSLQATGYLASTTDEYASALVNALCISEKEREKMCLAARSSIARFSEASFDQSFVNALERLWT